MWGGANAVLNRYVPGDVDRSGWIWTPWSIPCNVHIPAYVCNEVYRAGPAPVHWNANRLLGLHLQRSSFVQCVAFCLPCVLVLIFVFFQLFLCGKSYLRFCWPFFLYFFSNLFLRTWREKGPDLFCFTVSLNTRERACLLFWLAETRLAHNFQLEQLTQHTGNLIQTLVILTCSLLQKLFFKV